MPETYGDVPFIDPATGRFPDKFAPESVALDVKRAEDAAAAAATVKGEVEQIAGEAVEAAGEAVAAKGEAVAAAEEAKAVPAQVDTAMAAQVGAGGEFDNKLSANIAGQIAALTSGEPILGLGPVASRSEWPGTANPDGKSSGTDTYGNYRAGRAMLVDVRSVRLLFMNLTRRGVAADNVGLTPITVRCAVEVGGASGGNILGLVKFKGSESVTIPVGGYALSDPFPVALAAGEVLYTRTNVSVLAGGKWPLGGTMQGQGGYKDDGTTIVIASGGGEVGTGANVDKTLAGAITGTVFHYPVAAVIGAARAAGSVGPIVGLVADSKGTGSGDSGNPPPLHGRGYFNRALGSAGVGALNLAVGGSKNSDWTTDQALKFDLMRGLCKHVIVDLGTNDFNGGRTWAATQPDMIAVWERIRSIGAKVYMTTVIPSTTSTDAWATLENQTPRGREADRLACNAWLRDGAPMLDGAGAATGSNAPGTVRIGDAGHPVSVLFDFAAVTESSLNSGKFRIDLGAPTTDGVHPSLALHKQMAGAINTGWFT